MKLSDLFGQPNMGVHQYSIGGIAIVDTLATLAAAYGISWYLEKYHYKSINMWYIFIGLLVLSYPIHKLVGVHTRGVALMDSVLSKY